MEGYDFEEKKLHARQGVTKVNGELVFREPKTDNSIRPIDVDDKMIDLLKNRQKEQKKTD